MNSSSHYSSFNFNYDENEFYGADKLGGWRGLDWASVGWFVWFLWHELSALRRQFLINFFNLRFISDQNDSKQQNWNKPYNIIIDIMNWVKKSSSGFFISTVYFFVLKQIFFHVVWCLACLMPSFYTNSCI